MWTNNHYATQILLYISIIGLLGLLYWCGRNEITSVYLNVPLSRWFIIPIARSQQCRLVCHLLFISVRVYFGTIMNSGWTISSENAGISELKRIMIDDELDWWWYWQKQSSLSRIQRTHAIGSSTKQQCTRAATRNCTVKGLQYRWNDDYGCSSAHLSEIRSCNSLNCTYQLYITFQFSKWTNKFVIDSVSGTVTWA